MYSLRFVRPEDWAWWRVVHEEAFRARVEVLWGEWNEAVQGGVQRKEFEAADYAGKYVIVVDVVDAGWISWKLEPDYLYVANIILRPAFQRRGIGRDILKNLIAVAEARQIDVRLQTMLNNSAKEMYEKFGFVKVGESSNHHQMVRKHA